MCAIALNACTLSTRLATGIIYIIICDIRASLTFFLIQNPVGIWRTGEIRMKIEYRYFHVLLIAYRGKADIEHVCITMV